MEKVGYYGIHSTAFYCNIGPFLMHPVIRCIKSLHTKQSVINGVYNPMHVVSLHHG